MLHVALGCTDSHLHQYRTDSVVYSMASDDWDDGGDTGERGTSRCSAPTATPSAASTARAPARRRTAAAPPGYTELLVGPADPRHPEHEAMREWVGDRLRPFDQPAVDRRVRNAVGEVPESSGCCSACWPTASS